jgi:long-subunit acyl-CoA synthetase (AMP-forming)/alkylation response protein AidB-like acyl-CoA dehydrogenase
MTPPEAGVSPAPEFAPGTLAGWRPDPAADSIARLLAHLLDGGAARPAICDALAGRNWSWGEVIAAAADLADEFTRDGLAAGDRLAHLGPHSADWIVVDLACMLAGIVHCGLHWEGPAKERDEVLGWLAPRALVLTGPAGAHRPPRGAAAIDLRAPAGTEPARGRLDRAAAGPVDLARLWKRVARWAADRDPEACATIVLSSGTTGRPKGVLHSQASLAANAAASAEVFLDDDADVRLSWLPMSHAMARTGDLYTALVRGGCLNVVTDRQRLLDACLVLPPRVILGVPAFFERLERGVESGRIADLAAALGGRVRVCISGGGPLRRRTAAAFATRGVPLVEGYGLAEAGPVIALANPRTARPGSVGPPVAGVELRLDERSETRGQLLVRTRSRALGVIGPEAEGRPAAGGCGAAAAGLGEAATVAREPAADRDTWLETGDLAAIDADGQLRILGRVVETLVLSGGTKLPPAEVEAALAEDDAVAQVCVVGQGLAAPVAIIVPEPAVLRGALARLGVRVFSKHGAVSHPRVLAWLARRLARRQRRLPRAWRVRRAFLIDRPFAVERGEVTPSQKLRRREIAAAFAEKIAAAAADDAPAWVARVPVGAASGGADSHSAAGAAGAAGGWLAGALWNAGSAGSAARSSAAPQGFAEAAALRAEPLRDAVAEIVDHAEKELLRLKAESAVYDQLPGPAAEGAPLADAPRPPQGKLSRAAEEALAETGVFGLLVPERFGGAGATLSELVRGIARLATVVPTAAGILSVHSSIGAVASLVAFGSEEQRRRHLPGLARGLPLSIFAATEPDAGCDLHAVRARLERRDGRLLLSGTKMFITGAAHGRLVKLLATLDGRPTVALVRLPESDTAEFRLRHYALHPLKHAHNAALDFDGFPVDEGDLLDPGPAREGRAADGMRIVWHGLNRGRVTLAAQASGTLRLLLGQARDHALARSTWGRPIASRELVQGRLGRIAAATIACDALAAWAAAAIDAGQPGEIEAIAAKVVASECVRAAAIDALGVHGGRAFLVGHPLGDSFHDHFAVTVYEGESDLLGLALFKGLCKHHPLAGRGGDAAAPAAGLPRLVRWLAWQAGARGCSPRAADRRLLDRGLRDHAAAARRGLATTAVRIDRAIRRLGRGLADRQLLAGQLAAEVRELVSVLAVAHHADAAGDDDMLAHADAWCRMALARAGGRRLTPADLAAIAAAGRIVVDRGPPPLGDGPV